MRHILIVSSDPDVLKWHECSIETTVSSTVTARAELAKHDISLIILYADCVEEDITYSLANLREATSIPLMVITSEIGIDGKTDAINKGADAYLMNPCEEEITAVAFSLIRRHEFYNRQHNASVRHVASRDILIFEALRQVFVKEKKVSLTRIEFDILHLLMTNSKQIMSYEMIYHRVWGEGHEDNPRDMLHSHIKKLRKKLRAVSDTEYIRSVHSIGYSFNEL